jgi:hypothetical protein
MLFIRFHFILRSWIMVVLILNCWRYYIFIVTNLFLITYFDIKSSILSMCSYCRLNTIWMIRHHQRIIQAWSKWLINMLFLLVVYCLVLIRRHNWFSKYVSLWLRYEELSFSSTDIRLIAARTGILRCPVVFRQFFLQPDVVGFSVCAAVGFHMLCFIAILGVILLFPCSHCFNMFWCILWVIESFHSLVLTMGIFLYFVGISYAYLL